MALFPKKYISPDLLQRVSPITQTIVVLAFAGISMLILAQTSQNPEMEWMITCSALGFFVWQNILLFFLRKTQWLRYTLQSFALFLVLSVCLLTLASQISTTSIANLREYRVLLLTTFVFYILGTMVATLMKYIALMLGIND